MCFEAGEQEEVGPTALQAEGGRCASGGVRSAPSLTGPARLSVASKLSRVRALRSDHLSFPSALLAGRAMFRFFPPQAAGSVTELFQTLRQSDVGHSPQRHFTSYSLSHPKKARPFRLPSALPSPFPFPDDFVIGQVIPTGTTPTPYHLSLIHI